MRTPILKDAICVARELVAPKDVENMLRLNEMFVGPSVDAKQFTRFQAELGLQVLIASPISDLTKVHGYLWYHDADYAGQLVTQIARVFVHPSIQRCHNGFKLVTKLSELRGCRDMLGAAVDVSNEEGYMFFSSIGFAPSVEDSAAESEFLVRSKQWNPFPFEGFKT